jgi:AAHS family 4-hydroxybenzoate transporter-like MFS transporter
MFHSQEPGSTRTTASLVLCGLVMFIDGYDLSAMPLVVPHLVSDLGISAQRFGVALSAVLLGLGVGAIFLAPLGDLFGRRPTILVTTILIALTTLGTAFGHDVISFTLWRFATGVMLGACLPNVTALAADLAPQGRAARTVTLVSIGISLGGVAAGLLAPILVRIGGWQAVFVMSALSTLMLTIALYVLLPKSPAGGGKSTKQEGDESIAVVQLLSRPLLFSTVLFCALYATNALALYYLVSWVPTVLPRAGFSLDAASRYMSLIQFGGLIIGLALSVLLDRGWAVKAILCTYVCAIIALLLFSVFPPNIYSWGVLLIIAGGGISAVHLAIMAVAIGFFPQHLLSSAIGICVAVARLGAIGGPMLGSLAIGAGVSTSTFFAIAVLPSLICIGATLLIPRAKRFSASST